MESQAVMELLRELASNNGSYCRLLHSVETAAEQDKEQWLNQFRNCESCVEVVQKIEGWQ